MNTNKVAEVLARMLGAAETDCMDDRSNEWRSHMLDARDALASLDAPQAAVERAARAFAAAARTEQCYPVTAYGIDAITRWMTAALRAPEQPS